MLYFKRANESESFTFYGMTSTIVGLFRSLKNRNIMESKNAHMDSSGNVNNPSESKGNHKAYMKKYMQEYRKRKIRLEIYLSPDEFKKIKTSALRHRQKPSEHGKRCILSYIDETILITSEAELQNLRFEINKIGTNINQIAYQQNKTGGKYFDEQNFLNLINQLETILENHSTKTITKEVLVTAIKNSRLTLKQIESLLQL